MRRLLGGQLRHDCCLNVRLASVLVLRCCAQGVAAGGRLLVGMLFRDECPGACHVLDEARGLVLVLDS